MLAINKSSTCRCLILDLTRIVPVISKYQVQNKVATNHNYPDGAILLTHIVLLEEYFLQSISIKIAEVLIHFRQRVMVITKWIDMMITKYPNGPTLYQRRGRLGVDESWVPWRYRILSRNASERRWRVGESNPMGWDVDHNCRNLHLCPRQVISILIEE